MKSKKKFLGVFDGNFETYTRYLQVADKEQKKVFGVFNGSFFSNLVGGGHSFFNLFKVGLLKKSLGNPVVQKFRSKLKFDRF